MTKNKKEHGASLVEYVLLIALVSAIAIGSVSYMGKSTSNQICYTRMRSRAGGTGNYDPNWNQCESNTTIQLNPDY